MWTDLFQITFTVAGIETWVFVPPAVAFGISFFISMAGIMGAFFAHAVSGQRPGFRIPFGDGHQFAL